MEKGCDDDIIILNWVGLDSTNKWIMANGGKREVWVTKVYSESNLETIVDIYSVTP